MPVVLTEKEQRVLHILAREDYVSGESIAKELGVSRTAIWKTVKKIESLELLADAVVGKGYKLRDDITLISTEKVISLLPENSSQYFSIDVVGTTESTNDLVKDRIKDKSITDGSIVIAEQQTAGRGRMGRSWATPYAHQVAMTWHFELEGGDLSKFSGLSLAVGIAVVRELHKLGFSMLALKWPNDIYSRETGRKVGGILIELQQEAEGSLHVVVGLGLNCNSGSYLKRINPAASALDEAAPVDRNEVCVAILSAFKTLHTDIMTDKLGEYLSKWDDFNIYNGQKIIVRELGGKEHKGTDSGIGKDGSLLLKKASQTLTFYGNLCSIQSDT